MIVFAPLTRDDLAYTPGTSIGRLLEHDVVAIKAAISKQTSNGDYKYHSTGRVGKYALPITMLTELGYVDADGEWLGLHGFTTVASFLGSDHTQEQAMNSALVTVYDRLFNFQLFTDSTTVDDLAGLLIAAYFLGVSNVTAMVKGNTKHTELYTVYLKIGKQAIQISNS